MKCNTNISWEVRGKVCPPGIVKPPFIKSHHIALKLDGDKVGLHGPKVYVYVLMLFLHEVSCLSLR